MKSFTRLLRDLERSEKMARTCEGRGGRCSKTGAQHELLSGTVGCPKHLEHLLGPARPDEEGKPRMIWKTKLAEPYPLEFCEDVAALLIKHPKISKDTRVRREPERHDPHHVVPPPAPPTSAAGAPLQRAARR